MALGREGGVLIWQDGAVSLTMVEGKGVLLFLSLKELLGTGPPVPGQVLGEVTARVQTPVRAQCWRGDSVSFAVCFPRGVLLLCCADPAGAPAVRGSQGSPKGPSQQLPAPALSLCMCVFSFPAHLHVNESGWSEPAAAPRSQLGAQPRLTCGCGTSCCPRRGLLAMAQGPMTLAMALPCS